MGQHARYVLVHLLYAVALLALVEMGLLAGGSILVAVAGLVAAISVLVIVRPSLATIGVALTYLFAFTTAWNAVRIGPISPADIFFALGLVAFVAASLRQTRRWPTIPGWVLQLALVVVVIAALNILHTFDPNYLAHRVFLDSNGFPTLPEHTNFGITARWLISLIGVSALVGFAARWRARAMYGVAAAYAAGAAMSGLVAITDRLGLTSIGFRLLGVSYGTRQTGLSLHPNHLAEPCVLAAPIACWLIATNVGWRRIGSMSVLGAVLAGVYFSGSRGGAAIAAVAVVAAFLLLHGLRTRLVQLGAAAAILILVLFIRYPGLLGTVANTTRLNSDASTAFSDQARAILAAQAIDDFRHSPIYGNGLQIALSSHDIYRQTLAAGGVVLFASFVVFLVMSILRAAEFARRDQLGVALTVTVTAYAVLGSVENFLTDRYLYVPFALVVAGSARSWLDRPRDGEFAHHPVEQDRQPGVIVAAR